MKKDFHQAIEDRRSYYGISKETVVPTSRIKEIIDHSVQYTPTAFNSQSSRVVVLTESSHDQLWDIVKETLRPIVDKNAFKQTEDKLQSFKNGFGTVLFFEDQSIVEKLQEQYKAYAENFPIWSNQSSGILQFIVWTALELEGFGASLQHYNPLIDEKVKSAWDIPENWKMIAQMPFGKPTAEPGDKDFEPLDERIRYFS